MNKYHVEHIHRTNKLDHTYGNKLSINNWIWKKESDPEVPDVSARLSYSDNCLFVSFKVKENYTTAKCTKNQGKVHLDSCVEFFVAPNENGYFNFEINCIGTIHLYYRKNRNEGIPVSDEDIANIQICTSLQRGRQIITPLKNQYYEVWYIVPLSIFTKYSNCTLPTKGTTWRANFYKCGDETPEPSWGTWNKVCTPEPDFHRPEYFGEIIFE